MARVGLLDQSFGNDPKPLFDRLFKGDTWNKVITIKNRAGESTPSNPQNLTGWTFACKAYKYLATVPDGPLPNITEYEQITGDMGTNISCTPAADQSGSDRGKITVLVPGNIIDGIDIEINTTQEVPVLVIYIQYTDNATPPNTKTRRIVLAYTKGI